jgi:hypothetical protein
MEERSRRTNDEREIMEGKSWQRNDGEEMKVEK